MRDGLEREGRGIREVGIRSEWRFGGGKENLSCIGFGSLPAWIYPCFRLSCFFHGLEYSIKSRRLHIGKRLHNDRVH